MQNQSKSKNSNDALAIAALSNELWQMPISSVDYQKTTQLNAKTNGIDEVALQEVEQALLNQLDTATSGAVAETIMPVQTARRGRQPAAARNSSGNHNNRGGRRKARGRQKSSHLTLTRYRRPTRRISKRPLAAKDLGRWKPRDDFALITNVAQTADLVLVYLGTVFSCRFTFHDIQLRWCALLYDSSISKLAIAAMQNLHPEVVHAVQKKALYSEQEESMLCSFKSTDAPTLLQFEELLQNNRGSFLCTRTAKSLRRYWYQMKKYKLLSDQKVLPLNEHDELLTFSEAEELLRDDELIVRTVEPTLERELELADRLEKKQIRVLEAEVMNWNKLVDKITDAESTPTPTPTFDVDTLAKLLGRNVRYLMRSEEISLGRRTSDYFVDVDLSLEGASNKISRRQAIIRLRSNGDFSILNVGKRAIFINGKPLLCGHKMRLANNYMIEMFDVSLVFLINYELVQAVRKQSAKTVLLQGR